MISMERFKVDTLRELCKIYSELLVPLLPGGLLAQVHHVRRSCGMVPVPVAQAAHPEPPRLLSAADE